MTTRIQTFVNLIKLLGPVILMTMGVPASVVQIVINAIIEAEKFPGLSGKEKLNYVTDLTVSIMEATNAVRPNTFDVDKVKSVITAGVGMVIATINLFQTANTSRSFELNESGEMN